MGENIILFMVGQTVVLLSAGIGWCIHVETRLARIDERLNALNQNINTYKREVKK